MEVPNNCGYDEERILRTNETTTTRKQVMSKWIRNYNPTEIDTDEWDNILVLQPNGQKAVYNWEDYVDDGMQEQGCAWMPLPESDIPKTVSVTIEIGDHAYTIENNGFTIEVHDSRDPMGQPLCFQAKDTVTGIREIVDDLLAAELTADCGCDEPAEDGQDPDDFVREHLNNLRGNAESAIEVAYQKSRPWNKKKLGSYDVD